LINNFLYQLFNIAIMILC